MFDLVAAQDRFDHPGIALAQDIAEREKLVVVGQAARHRLAVLAHMAVVAVGRHAQGAAFHGIEHQAPSSAALPCR